MFLRNDLDRIKYLGLVLESTPYLAIGSLAYFAKQLEVLEVSKGFVVLHSGSIRDSLRVK